MKKMHNFSIHTFTYYMYILFVGVGVFFLLLNKYIYIKCTCMVYESTGEYLL